MDGAGSMRIIIVSLLGTLLVLRDTASASSLFNDKELNNKSRAVRQAFLEEAARSPSQGLFLPHLHHLKRTRHGLYRPVRQPLHQEQPNSNARLTRIKHYVLRRLQNKHGQRDVGLNGIIPDLLPEADNHSVRVLDTAWYGNSYIPYRYRCQTSGHCSPRPALAQPTEPPIASQRPPIAIPPCVHLRWNYELPFSELPNLVFSFLAFDMVSGQTLTEKSRFLSILLEAGANAYMSANSSADVFEVPDAIDTTSCSIKRSVEPLIDSLHQLLNLYTSRDQRLLLALVQATKACLDKSEMPFPQELLPCLDYSFGQEQLLDLLQPRSVFGNRELCRKHLRHNISLCLPAQPHSCNEKHLIVLRNFARMYYKCANSVPPTVQKPGESGGKDDLAAIDEDEFADLQMAQEKSSAAFSPNSAHSSAFLTLFLLTKWCLFFVFTGPIRLL